MPTGDDSAVDGKRHKRHRFARCPQFSAFPLTSWSDATVFLHETILSDTQGNHRAEFDDVKRFLLSHEPAHSSVQKRGKSVASRHPRLSVASEVTFRRPGKIFDHTARGLVCFSERQTSISITLRGIKCPEDEQKPSKDEAPKTPSWLNEVDWLAWNYEPMRKRSEGFWFTIDDQCRVLYKLVFAGSAPVSGLVVLTGGTNSAKSEIARGLIHKYLIDRKDSNPPRRPHLVTFEDPIETFFVGPKPIDETKLPKKPRSELSSFLHGVPRSEWNRKLCDRLRKLPKSLLAQWQGFDYTPRERGVDVHDLSQAFNDALRQTPTVFFVGEIRDPREWAEVLEFAGTGHLVVTTAHAGSLLEAMVKIFTAVGARTPADRRRFAARLLAVIHLRPRVAEEGVAKNETTNRSLLLPALWRKTDRGLAALSANGFGAIVPETPQDGKEAGISSLGRRWFAGQLITDLRTPSEKWLLTQDDATQVSEGLRTVAANLDLKGE